MSRVMRSLYIALFFLVRTVLEIHSDPHCGDDVNPGSSRKSLVRGAAFSRMSFDVMGLRLFRCLRLTERLVPW